MQNKIFRKYQSNTLLSFLFSLVDDDITIIVITLVDRLAISYYIFMFFRNQSTFTLNYRTKNF